MKHVKSLISISIGAAALFSASVMAENHVVTAEVSNFVPLIIQIQPGDTVSFENMAGHITNTIFIDSKGEHQYIPEGAQGWTSAMGENFTTPPLTIEGVYLYKCDPHWGMGMGGAIVVGEPKNIQEILDSKPKGKAKSFARKIDKMYNQ